MSKPKGKPKAEARAAAAAKEAREKKEAEEKAARQAEAEKRAKEEERANRMKNQPPNYRRRVFSDFMETSGRVRFARVHASQCS
jgi:hypothetical protein